MRLFEFARNRVKFTFPGAQRTANAGIFINNRLFLEIQLAPHGAGRAMPGTFQTADTFFTVNHRQVVFHRDRAELAFFCA